MKNTASKQAVKFFKPSIQHNLDNIAHSLCCITINLLWNKLSHIFLWLKTTINFEVVTQHLWGRELREAEMGNSSSGSPIGSPMLYRTAAIWRLDSPPKVGPQRRFQCLQDGGYAKQAAMPAVNQSQNWVVSLLHYSIRQAGPPYSAEGDSRKKGVTANRWGSERPHW